VCVFIGGYVIVLSMDSSSWSWSWSLIQACLSQNQSLLQSVLPVNSIQSAQKKYLQVVKLEENIT